MGLDDPALIGFEKVTDKRLRDLLNLNQTVADCPTESGFDGGEGRGRGGNLSTDTGIADDSSLLHGLHVLARLLQFLLRHGELDRKSVV